MIIPNGSAAVCRASFVWTFEIPASCRRQAPELSPEKVAVTRLPVRRMINRSASVRQGWICGSLPRYRRRAHRCER